MTYNRSVRNFFLLWSALAGLFLVMPLLIVFVNSIGLERYVVFPPKGFSLRWYFSIPSYYWQSTAYALQLAAAAVFSSALLAVPAALAIVRGNMPLKTMINSLLRSPMQIPLLISGVAFLQYYNLIWGYTSYGLAGSFTGLWIAHTIVVSPYILVTVVAQLSRYDHALDEAAYGMGASLITAFWKITMPIIRPSIFAGAFFAFLMSFDNVPLSIFLIESGKSTLPLDLFFSVEQDLSRAHYALGGLVTIVSTTFILLVQRFLGLLPAGE